MQVKRNIPFKICKIHAEYGDGNNNYFNTTGQSALFM